MILTVRFVSYNVFLFRRYWEQLTTKPQQEQLRMVQAKKHKALSDTTRCCVPQVLVHSSCAMSGDATHSQIYQQQLLKKQIHAYISGDIAALPLDSALSSVTQDMSVLQSLTP